MSSRRQGEGEHHQGPSYNRCPRQAYQRDSAQLLLQYRHFWVTVEVFLLGRVPPHVDAGPTPGLSLGRGPPLSPQGLYPRG